MATQNDSKLNHLQQLLPEGLLVDAAWLSGRGYSSSLRAKYVAAGWLEQPARRTFRRPRGTLGWEQVVVSLQALLGYRLVVGGRTALELQGYVHYLATTRTEVHLHGPERPPTWLATLPLPERFAWRNSVPLFGDDDLARVVFPALDAAGEGQGASAALGSLAALDDSAVRSRPAGTDVATSPSDAGLRVLPWGQWGWPLVVSTPERAALELLDELPDHESFHQADALMEGLGDLGPRRLQVLLARCRSVKVKRLFLFFADRHGHAWAKHLDRAAVHLGSGKRVLARGGWLDPVYGITLPRDLVPHEREAHGWKARDLTPRDPEPTELEPDDPEPHDLEAR